MPGMRSKRRATTSTAGLPARPAVLVVDRHGWTSIVVRGDLDDAQTGVLSQLFAVLGRTPEARTGHLTVNLQAVTRCSQAGLQLVASLVARGVAIEAQPVVAGSGPIASARSSVPAVAADERRRATGGGFG
jgi:hypothetical protein